VTALLDALDRDPRFAAFGLAAAALKRPRRAGSLNIEALCETDVRRLRSVSARRCPAAPRLIAPLDNPAETVNGQPPRFARAVLLDLGGNGIRAMIRAADVFSPVGLGAERRRGTPLRMGGRIDTPPVLRPVRFPADNHARRPDRGRRGGARRRSGAQRATAHVRWTDSRPRPIQSRPPRLPRLSADTLTQGEKP
jgi:hypothetical protein